ncbi:ketosteroid isomerase-like protein [Methanolinea mesophila]|uniref:nuclear transport factor 2 family protein n=1 Tax=Methanolinea mesophila TaxID=547055 RepID=UPI001AE80945|nr:nuclear transport factor 2 family protein [Methanolinea mesophila]MBP1929503.1 ketosteroid isomerase-like protein [Methanolinea mesophila]
MEFTEETIQEIMDTFTRYAECYEKRDIQGFKALLSQYAMGFGTGVDEISTSRSEFLEAVRRDLSQADSINVTFCDLIINGDGRVVWVMGLCTFDAMFKGCGLSMTGRFTAVLLNTGARWIFEQLHFSMPYEGQEQGRSFPDIEG